MEFRILILVVFSLPSLGQELMFDTELLDPESHEQWGRLLESIEKIDLNRADSVELVKTNLFTPEEVSKIIKYRYQYGDFISTLELQSLGFEPHFIGKITPFLLVDESHGLSLESSSELLLQSSYRTRTNSETTGRTMVRFRHKGVRSSYSLLLENDKGEKLNWDVKERHYGPDFISGHLKVTPLQGVELVLGDFTVQTGEGLIFSSGLSLGKNAETILSLKKALSGIKPYMSSGESGYFRGVAVKTEIGKLKMQALFSRQRRNATLYEDSYFRSFNTSGLHRSESEISRRKTVKEVAAGFNISYQLLKGEVGVNALIIDWEYPKVSANTIANKFRFSGSTPLVGSFYLNKSWRNLHTFNEFAWTSIGKGLLSGATFNLSNKTELGLIARLYDPTFFTVYGNGFGEYYQTTNERGIYMGVSHRFSRAIKWSGYADIFRFPWLRSSIKIPSSGYEYLMVLSYSKRSGPDVVGKWRHEFLDHDKEFRSVSKHNYSLTIKQGVGSNWEIRSRIQGSSRVVGGARQAGYLASSELIAKLKNTAVSSRFTFFQTQDFENRQYVFERDVLYSFSLPAFNGTGIRGYVLLKLSPIKDIDLWLRLARTLYLEEITEIDVENTPNRVSEIKIQLRYNLKN